MAENDNVTVETEQTVSDRAVEAAGPSALKDALAYCPTCSTELVPARCKLICPACGLPPITGDGDADV